MIAMTPLKPALIHLPSGLHAASDYEELAAEFLSAPSLAYIAGGSGNDVTSAANLDAFRRATLWPRPLQASQSIQTTMQLASRTYTHPIFLAPVAHQLLVHARAELETARAAAVTGSVMVVSTLSSQRLEAIAEVAGGEKWFQLYWQTQREHTLSLLQRAQTAGYAAIMLTVDAGIQLPSKRALQAGFVMPQNMQAANLQDWPYTNAANPTPGIAGLMACAPCWADVQWLLQQTTLPVWIKGVMHPEDAQRLRDMGVAGVVVSNHGGRTVDGVPASLQALPKVRSAVGPDFPLLLDSGIRSGRDVFTALAAGADAVMIGRLQLYALSVAGALGVAHMLRLLREELEVCMAVAGCASLQEVRARGCIGNDS
jgi:4-hydroxymandelate oxidase